MKNMLFVFNPHSGKAQIKNKLLGILDTFSKEGYRVEVHVTQARDDARQIVAAHAKGKGIVVCSGGDGTLNETVSGLMELEKRPVLGYIPTGTTNDFAASLKLSKNMLQAADTVVQGKPFACDIGSFNERYFAYVAAFGLFTDVPYVTPQEAKNILGHQAYLLEGVKRFSNIHPCRMEFTWEDQMVEGDFIYGMISNATSVGGFKNLTGDNVRMDDGLFEVMLVKMPKNPLDFSEIISALILKDVQTDYICKFKTNKLRVISAEPIDWVLDGEYGGSRTDVVIENHKRAVSVRIDPDKFP